MSSEIRLRFLMDDVQSPIDNERGAHAWFVTGGLSDAAVRCLASLNTMSRNVRASYRLTCLPSVAWRSRL